MADSSPLAHSPTLAATEPRADGVRLEAGAKIGDYVVERFIGAGAMGEVYAGKHPVIGKRVAIKVLRPELAASAEAAERFIREARAVNQIEHENVIDVFAFGRLDDGRLYLVMDLVEGRSLRAHLVNGPLPVSTALDILEVIAGALDAAHDKGVVHRDLKPDNIVLSNATPPKIFVLDFGIAKLISKANEGSAMQPGTLTGAGTWLGTPGYMAPEQWSVDGARPASDRYALGVIAFELLSGALPFSATSVPGMMEQHFRAEVPALSARGAVGVPAAIDGVIERALAKDPDARYASAAEFVAALRSAAGASSGAQRGRGAVAAPVQRRPWVPAAIGAGVLGVGLVAVVMTRDREERRPSPSSEREAERESRPRRGMVAIELRSTPSGAEVRSGDKLIGTTPTRIEMMDGESLELTATKPGFLSERKHVTANAALTELSFSLGEVIRFQGVWRTPTGELRELERSGDQVSVYKRREVSGAREFFKNYKFTTAERGVAFAADDEVVDPRAPNDPRCHVPVRVEYRYDPEHDVLEQHPEKVTIDLHDGSCVVRSRRVVPITLARVDQPSHDLVEIAAPAGGPKKRKPTKKVDLGLDEPDKGSEAKQKLAVQSAKNALPPPTKRPPPAPAQQKLEPQQAPQKPSVPQVNMESNGGIEQQQQRK